MAATNEFEDVTALLMRDAFTNKPDKTPFVALKNEIPMDEMNPEPTTLNSHEKYFAR